MTRGDTPPENPNDGDLWIDTSDGTVTEPVDYIVERGVQDGWRYTKWNSGYIEASQTFIKTDQKLNYSSAGWYRFNPNGNFETPSDLFIEIYNIKYSGHTVGTTLGFPNVRYENSRWVYNFFRGTSNDTAVDCYLTVTVDGRWK